MVTGYCVTMKALAAAAFGSRWSYVMIMLYEDMLRLLWLHYGYVVAAALAAASARRETVFLAAVPAKKK